MDDPGPVDGGKQLIEMLARIDKRLESIDNEIQLLKTEKH